jgi:hypothetical protein
MISSYKAAQLHMEKARNKAKGRPMKGAGWRLFQDGDEYVVTVSKTQIGRFLPDNTFMFTVSGVEAYPVSYTLSGTMHRNLPFHWARVANKVYRVDHEANMTTQVWDHFQQPTNAPQVYDGLKFDLTTGRCLNYKPDYKREVDLDRRKEWLAASAAWKRKLKVIARIGGLDSFITHEKQNPTGWREKPKWGMDEWLDILYKAIKDGDCSPELLSMFAASEVSPWNPCTSMQLYESIDRITKNQSVELRRRFGVFKEAANEKIRI